MFVNNMTSIPAYTHYGSLLEQFARRGEEKTLDFLVAQDRQEQRALSSEEWSSVRKSIASHLYSVRKFIPKKGRVLRAFNAEHYTSAFLRATAGALFYERTGDYLRAGYEYNNANRIINIIKDHQPDAEKDHWRLRQFFLRVWSGDVFAKGHEDEHAAYDYLGASYSAAKIGDHATAETYGRKGTAYFLRIGKEPHPWITVYSVFATYRRQVMHV